MFYKTKFFKWKRESCTLTKADLVNATGVDTKKFAKKVDLPNSKSRADKLDIDKLKMYQAV